MQNCILLFKNKSKYALTIFLFYHANIFAQSTTGITNKPDTSYTTYSAYSSEKKKYPNIKIAGEFHSKSVKEKKNITYCKIGERKLLIDAFYPSSKQKLVYAAVIIIHGGGWRSGNRSQHYPLAQRLAGLGYVCFTPEYRLSTEALYPAAVFDIKAALRWMHAHAKEYNLDTAKIVVAGFSSGGQLAALAGTTMNIPSFEGSACNLNYSSAVQAIIDLD